MKFNKKKNLSKYTEVEGCKSVKGARLKTGFSHILDRAGMGLKGGEVKERCVLVVGGKSVCVCVGGGGFQ